MVPLGKVVSYLRLRLPTLPSSFLHVALEKAQPDGPDPRGPRGTTTGPARRFGTLSGFQIHSMTGAPFGLLAGGGGSEGLEGTTGARRVPPAPLSAVCGRTGRRASRMRSGG